MTFIIPLHCLKYFCASCIGIIPYVGSSLCERLLDSMLLYNTTLVVSNVIYQVVAFSITWYHRTHRYDILSHEKWHALSRHDGWCCTAWHITWDTTSHGMILCDLARGVAAARSNMRQDTAKFERTLHYMAHMTWK